MAQRGQWQLQNPTEREFTGWKGTYWFENGVHTAILRNLEKRDRVMETFYFAHRLDKDYGPSEVQAPAPQAGVRQEVPVSGDIPAGGDGSEEASPDERAGAGGAEAGTEGSIPSGDGRGHAGDDTDDPIADRLSEALTHLDPSNEEHWTKGGKPRIDAVEKFFGGAGVTRADITRVAPDLTRQ